LYFGGANATKDKTDIAKDYKMKNPSKIDSNVRAKTTNPVKKKVYV
jgi:hypothetical protein